MNKHDLSGLRKALMQEIKNLQDGKTSINQAKQVAALANATINSCLVEIAETKALPDNPNKQLTVDYIDGTVLSKEAV